MKIETHKSKDLSVGVQGDVIVMNVQSVRIEMTKEEAVRLAQLLAMAVA